jgi:hypothetical protein
MLRLRSTRERSVDARQALARRWRVSLSSGAIAGYLGRSTLDKVALWRSLAGIELARLPDPRGPRAGASTLSNWLA